MVPAADNKKILHSMLASRVSSLKIPSCSSSSSTADPDLDFSELFGPAPASSTPTGLFLGDTQVIHNRSHSFVGPSPRFTLSKSLPFHQELDSGSENDDENEVEEANDEKSDRDRDVLKIEHGEEVRKIGPGDFEILRVIGKGAFGKVFQVRKKGSSGISSDGDGVFAMKVMRKDTIIKNNHVDYMKAERGILTKVVHPFIVQLRYSFQLLEKDPSKRLGSGPRGGYEIKSHKWFPPINWKKLEARELQPKFKPDVSGRDSTANFDRCWTAMPPDDSPTPIAGEFFQGYTYVAPNPRLSSSE